MVLSPQVMRFLVAGWFGVFLYYLILYILTDIVGVWYMVSAVTASVLNNCSNFVLQKFWTFQDKSTKNVHRQAFWYVIMAASIFVANLALLYVLVEYFHLWYLAAQFIVSIILAIISYLASRRIFVS